MKTNVSSVPRFPSRHFPLLSLLFLVMALASCSGGGGGGGSSVAATSISGSVNDAPITGGTITITQNAPLGQPGAVTLGTTTAGGDGHYSLASIPIPQTQTAIYANAQGGQVFGQDNPEILLTAYLGQGQNLASAGSDLSEGNDPDLVVSQVTTAAVAIASDGGKNYQLSGYSATLAADQTPLIELAAEIMCQVDGGDTLPSGENTLTFANSLVTQVPPSATADYLTAPGAFTTSTCPGLTTYLSMVTTSGDWDAELQGGDHPVASLNIPAGSYSFQGLMENTGMGQVTSTTVPSPTTPSLTSFTLSLTLAANGTISQPQGSTNVLSISSGSGINGQILTLILTDNAGNTYTLTGTLKTLPANWHSASTNAYVFEGGGTDSTTQSSTSYLLNMDGVLYQGNDGPLWSSFSPLNGQENESCNNGGFKLRATFPASGSVPTFPVCFADQSQNTLQLTNISDGQSESRDELGSSNVPSSISATLTNSPAPFTETPFIMSGPLTLGTTTTNTMFYVLGTNNGFFTTDGQNQTQPSCTLTVACTSGDTAGSVSFSGNILAFSPGDH